jgi:hypothetical protein
MKKLISVLLTLVLIFSFAGCSGDNNEETNAVQRGTIKNNVYSSKTTGLRFTKPDNWRYLTDKELSQALSISEEAISKKEFAASLEEYPNLMDMMIMDDATGLNMTVGYENLPVTMGSPISEQEYMDAMSEFISTMGNVQIGKSETVTLSGQDYLHTEFSVDIDGTTMITQYYIRLIMDKYMSVISVAYTSDVEAPDIEKMFS